MKKIELTKSTEWKQEYIFSGEKLQLEGKLRLGSVKDPTALNNLIIVEGKKIEILIGYKPSANWDASVLVDEFLEENGIYKDITNELKNKNAIAYIPQYTFKEEELPDSVVGIIPNAPNKGQSLVNIRKIKVNEDCFYWCAQHWSSKEVMIKSTQIGKTPKLDKSSDRFNFLTEYILGKLFSQWYIASAAPNFIDQKNNPARALIRGHKFQPYFRVKAGFPEEIKNKIDELLPYLEDIGHTFQFIDGDYYSDSINKNRQILPILWFMDWEELNKAVATNPKWKTLKKDYKSFDFGDYLLDANLTIDKNDRIISFIKTYTGQEYKLQIVINDVGIGEKQAHPHIPAIYIPYGRGTTFHLYTAWRTAGYWYSTLDKEYTNLFKNSRSAVEILSELLKIAIAQDVIYLDESKGVKGRKISFLDEEEITTSLEKYPAYQGYTEWGNLFTTSWDWGAIWAGAGKTAEFDFTAIETGDFKGVNFFDPSELASSFRTGGYNFHHPYNKFRKGEAFYNLFSEENMSKIWPREPYKGWSSTDGKWNFTKLGNALYEKGGLTEEKTDVNYITEGGINTILSHLQSEYASDEKYSIEKIPEDKPLFIDLVNTLWIAGIQRSSRDKGHLIVELLPKDPEGQIIGINDKLYIPNSNQEGKDFYSLSKEEKLAWLVENINQQNTLYVKGTKFPIKQKLMLERREINFPKFNLKKLIDIDKESESLYDYWRITFEGEEDSIDEVVSLIKKERDSYSTNALQLDELKQRHYHERTLKDIDRQRHQLEFSKFNDLNRLRGVDIANREFYGGAGIAGNIATNLLGVGFSIGKGAVGAGAGISNAYQALGSLAGLGGSIASAFQHSANIQQERALLEHENKFGKRKYAIDADSLIEDKRYMDELQRNEIFRATNSLNIHLANEADIQESVWREIYKSKDKENDYYGVCFINRYCEGLILAKLIEYTKNYGFDVFIAQQDFKKNYTGPLQYYRIDSININNVESLGVIKENLLRGIYIVDDLRGEIPKSYWEMKYEDMEKKKKACEGNILTLKKHLEEEEAELEKNRGLLADWNKKYEGELKRYHELSEEYRAKEAKLAEETKLKNLYLDQKRTLEGEKEVLTTQKIGLEHLLSVEKTKVEKTTKERDSWIKQAKEVEGERDKLKGEKANLESELTNTKEQVDSCVAEKGELNKEIENWKEKEKNWNSNREALNNQLSSCKKQLTELQSEKDSLTVAKGEVDQELTTTKENLESKKKELQTTKEELDKVKKNLDSAKNHALEVQSKVHQLEVDVDSKKKQIEQLTKDKEQAVEQWRIWHKLSTEEKEKTKKLETDIQDKEDEIVKLEEEAREASEKISKCEKDKKSLEAEIAQIKNQVETLTNKDTANELEKQRLGKESEEQRAQLAEKDRQITELKKKEKELEEVKKQIEELKKDAAGIEEELAKAKVDINNYLQRLKEAEDQIKSDRALADQYKQIARLANRQKESIGKRYEELKKEADKKTQELESKKQELKTTQDSLQSSQENISKLEEEKVELGEQLVQLKAEKQQLEEDLKGAGKAEVAAKEREIAQCKEQIKQIQTKITEAEKARDEAIAEKGEAEEEIKNKKVELTKIKQELSQLQNKQKEEEAKTQKLQEEVDSCKVEKEELQREIKTHKESVESLKKEIEQHKETIKSKEQEIKDKESQLTHHSKQLETNKAELDKKTKELETKNKELEAEKDKLNKIQTQHTEVSQKLSKAEEELIELEEVKRELQSKKQSVTEQEGKIKEKEGEITKLTNEQNKLKRELEAQKELVSQKQAEVEKVKKEKEDAVNNMQSRIAEMENQLKTKTSDYEECRTQVQEKSGQLDEKNKQYNTLSESFRKKEEELTQQKNLVTLYLGEKTKLSQEKAKAEEEKTKLTQEKKKLESQLEESNNKVKAKETELERQNLEIIELKGQVGVGDITNFAQAMNQLWNEPDLFNKENTYFFHKNENEIVPCEWDKKYNCLKVRDGAYCFSYITKQAGNQKYLFPNDFTKDSGVMRRYAGCMTWLYNNTRGDRCQAGASNERSLNSLKIRDFYREKINTFTYFNEIIGMGSWETLKSHIIGYENYKNGGKANVNMGQVIILPEYSKTYTDGQYSQYDKLEVNPYPYFDPWPTLKQLLTDKVKKDLNSLPKRIKEALLTLTKKKEAESTGTIYIDDIENKDELIPILPETKIANNGHIYWNKQAKKFEGFDRKQTNNSLIEIKTYKDYCEVLNIGEVKKENPLVEEVKKLNAQIKELTKVKEELNKTKGELEGVKKEKVTKETELESCKKDLEGLKEALKGVSTLEQWIKEGAQGPLDIESIKIAMQQNEVAVQQSRTLVTKLQREKAELEKKIKQLEGKTQH